MPRMYAITLVTKVCNYVCAARGVQKGGSLRRRLQKLEQSWRGADSFQKIFPAAKRDGRGWSGRICRHTELKDDAHSYRDE